MKRMKKPLAWLLSALLLFTALPVTAFADEVAPAVTAAVDATSETAPTAEPVPETEPEPSSAPTAVPSVAPTEEPVPNSEPSSAPTAEPTAAPTEEPDPETEPEPSSVPTAAPTVTPTEKPAPEIGAEPSSAPTAAPTTAPTATPEAVPVEDPYVPGFTVIESELGGAHAWPVPEHFDVTQGYGDQHAALDIAADTGTPVVAADDGTVTVTQTWNGVVTKGDNNSYGNMVQVTHADGTVTLYAHLSEINVRQGDTVVRGQQIGRVGSTGNSSGPHLHFEVRSNGSKVDPMAYITEDSTDAEKKFEELLEQYGGCIGEDGQLHTIDGREAIDKTLAEIAEEAGLNLPVFYANNVTVSEPRSTYLMNIGYVTDVEGATNGWGGKRINGKVAYCVEHGIALGLGDNSGYTQQDLTKEQMNRLTLIDYWGRHKNIANVKGCSAVNHDWDTIDVSAEYMAEFYTQLLIWETIHDFGGSFVGASSISIPSTVGGMDNIASQSTYNAFKKAVMEKVNLFYTTPSITGQTVTMKIGETVTLTDTTGALASYIDTPLVNTTGISVAKQGNKVILTATGNPNPTGIVSFAYNVDLDYYTDGPGYYYEHAVSQDVATCGFSDRDPTFVTFNVNVEMNGQLKIVKTSDTGKVEGISFRVTRLKDNYSKVYKTDASGLIFTETLPIFEDNAGTTKYQYLVEELDTEETFGYELPDPQTVELSEGEIASVSFHNKPIEIGTKATVEGEKEVDPLDKVTLTDTVSYTGLVPGKEYKVTGVLMDKETSEKLLVDGKGITAETVFVPETKNGSVDVTFVFDATGLHGKEIVVFEDLYRENIKVAAHADITDDDQTIKVKNPEIGTTASFEGEKEIDPLGKVTLTDTVSYKDLTPGKEYRVTGVLMDKETGEKLLVDGKEITAETVFVPETKNGSVDVTFIFDATGLHGKEIVVFEDLYRENVLLATHADINDEGQTVKIKNPEIGTKATADGKKEITADKITITDVVSYKDLTPGKEYKLTGVLMNKATNDKLLIDGKEITAEATFTPKATTGEVEMTFTFDARELTVETEIVAFETLYRNGIEIAVHADIEDEGQTVKILPLHGSIMTTKVNADDPTDKISGATFGVYSDADGDGIFNAKTDKLVGTLQEGDTGVYTLDSLPYGKFFLHENKAPEGFVQDNIYYPFEIKEDGQIVNFETVPGKDFPNKPIKGTVTTTKVDATNPQHKLSGAVFEIYRDADGDGRYTEGVDTLIGRMDEIETGFYSLSNLVYGKYLIYEAQAPANFVRDTIYYPFSITEDGQTVTFETIPGKDFPNSPVPNRPKTGSSRSVLPYIAFAGSALGLTTVLLVRRKKSR